MIFSGKTAGALAQIQYLGISGLSTSCLNAVRRFVQFGDKINEARILTSSERHALLLHVNEDEVVAVKAGFTHPITHISEPSVGAEMMRGLA
jgi:hypothetical protein